ncbi:MAG: pyrroline-5-carboxylate reductase [Candidatus Geothermincolales bacterium]
MMGYRVAVIGAGRMGGAVIRALVERGGWDPSSVGASDRDAQKIKALAEGLGIRGFSDNAEACLWTDAVVLAVKPQHVGKVLDEISSSMRGGQLFITVVMGKPISYFRQYLPPGVGIVRAMPNTPALIGKGITAVSFEEDMTEEDRKRATQILSCLGELVELDENLQDAAMAVSGCGPAYFFLVAEAMMEAGVRLGLDASTALSLAVHTMIGAGELLKARGEHPAVLKGEVTSPGGSTIAALEALEESGLRASFFRAIRAAWSRAREV